MSEKEWTDGLARIVEAHVRHEQDGSGARVTFDLEDGTSIRIGFARLRDGGISLEGPDLNVDGVCIFKPTPLGWKIDKESVRELLDELESAEAP